METAKHGWLYSQLFANWKQFEVKYVSLLILLQVVVYAISPDSPIGMISGIGGVLCLVYGMKGRKISFVFGVYTMRIHDLYCLDTVMRTGPLPWILFM